MLMPLFALIALVALPSCGVYDKITGRDELNPPQQAYVINKEYQTAAHGVLACKKVPECWEFAGPSLVSANAVAIAYVDDVTVQAKAWNDAPVDKKPEELGAFNSLVKMARDAILGMRPKE